MSKLKLVLTPKKRKIIKSFGLSEEAVQRLLKLREKTGLPSSEIINQILLEIDI